ncbi:MAG TPA: hypothetical protein PKJ97_02615, partial [Candidatus Bilamarchaeaceae archaeon]|nr:hypothetical protein [Candidatus Bilamarchaeaceae archaeon]
FFEEWKAQRKELERLKEGVVEAKAKEIVRKGGLVEERLDLDAKALARIGALVSESEKAMAILTNGEGNFVCAAGKGAERDALQLFEGLKKRGARGGGNGRLVSGKII